MSMDILKSKKQISDSRRELVKSGASAIDSVARKIMKKIGFNKSISVGDMVKSWDVLKSIQFLEGHISKESAILDLGCFASEIIVALHQRGYKNLYGVDLNDKVLEMPHKEAIKYIKSDFMRTPLASESFDAITSISVIEHGYDGERLLKEVSRLLKPGGFFISSFDFWPDKIDTKGTKFFGMDWLIFSKEDVLGMIKLANDVKMVPYGELKFEAEEKCISCAEKDYTFAWLVLQKK